MKPVEEIIRLCPLWTELAVDDKLQRNKMTKELKRLQQYDLRTIRDGMASYIKKANYSSYTVKQMGQLFVLNRFLFAVPDELPLGSIPFFGGWDVPVNGGMVNSSWPWSFNQRTQKICLTGLFSGYSGDQFLALEEFDYLRARFGRRRYNVLPKPSFRRTEQKRLAQVGARG